jgi:hypothetical protein
MEYMKPSRVIVRNPVAKNTGKFNRAIVERSRKSDYTRKGKSGWKFKGEM